MPNKQSLQKELWQTDIEDWEAHRYGGKISLQSVIHWATRNSNRALRHRMQIPLIHLAPHISSKHITEIGCGAAPLCREFIKLGARAYHGYDISEKALQAARNRAGSDDRITFECMDVLNIPALNTDFVFSAGFTHWISLDRVDHMLKIGRGVNFLHHFSERRLNLKQILRYLHLRSIGAPVYQHWYPRLADIHKLVKQNGYESVYVFKHSALGSITFFSTLPFPDDLIHT